MPRLRAVKRAAAGLREARHDQHRSSTRRAFLTSTGALVVIARAARRDGPKPRASDAATRPPLKGDQLASYITDRAGRHVIAYYGKIDGGQGLGTVDRPDGRRGDRRPDERVRVVMGDTG